MTKNLENKLERESIIKTSFNYARKKILPYALTGALLFSSIAPAYSANKANTVKTTAKASSSILKSWKFWTAVGTVVAGGIYIYTQQEEEKRKKQEQDNRVTPAPTPTPSVDDQIKNDPTGDYDFDGMPNGWELAYGLNPKIDDANEDKDGDGYKNIIEYREGSNPNDKNSIPQGDSHDLSVLSMPVIKAIYNKSPLETTLNLNPYNPSVHIVLPLSDKVILTGNKSIFGPDYQINVNLKF